MTYIKAGVTRVLRWIMDRERSGRACSAPELLAGTEVAR